MKKRFLIHLLLSSVLCLLPLVVFLVFGQQLPEQVPIHWDQSGAVNGTISKTLLICGFPIALLLIHLIRAARPGGDGIARLYLVPLVGTGLSIAVLLLALYM